MGIANELSEAGMAASAIVSLVEAVKAKFPHGLGAVEAMFISRSAKLAYRIETRENRLPAGAVVRLAVDVAGLRDRIDREVAKLR
jgi:hypothetical protein